MHRFRAKARQAAWYTEDGEPPNYNPFQKVRSRVRDLCDDDEEAAVQGRPNHSEAYLPNAAEDHRLSQYEPSSSGPQHANTFPPDLPTTATAPLSLNTKLPDHPREDPSEDSTAGTSATLVPEKPPLETRETQDTAGPRNRKRTLMDRLHKRHGDASEIERTATSESRKKHKQKFTAVGQVKATLFNSWINVLLVMVPVGIAVHFTNITPGAIFAINFIAIIPLAALLSYATEEIALRTGETIGGLLNATFGNAVELIVSIIALTQNQVLIVQTSLIGSMLSNLLLVMGMCFFFGGLNRVEQHFNITVAQTAASLLALAVGALTIPAAFDNFSSASDQITQSDIIQLSRGTAVILLLVYGCYLYFQLKTHAETYNAPSEKVPKKNKVEKGDAFRGIAQNGANISASMGGENAQTNPLVEPDDEKAVPQLSIGVAVFTLAASTALVGICAEFLVDSINDITDAGGLSKTFVGLILLPIVGNAAEHATAVTVACKDKMDLAIGVAVGSSLQIALLVLPFIVVLGWILGNDAMNLDFDGFQIIVLFIAILLVNYLIQDGKSHWLEGVLLQTLYIIIAIAAWFYPSKTSVA